MQTPLPYVAPSKGLIRSLETDVRTLAHERLADMLRCYQSLHSFDDETIAMQMNACASVLGIRGRDDDVHAPISAAKVTRFKDRKTKPQSQTLDQMTAFFGERLGAHPLLFWADMDDVLTALHDARRFRKERTRKDLIDLSTGWLFADLFAPTCAMAFQLTPLANNPIILTRGRIAVFEEDKAGQRTVTDVCIHGYATLTAKNLNLHMRDSAGRQFIVTIDVDAGPFEDDSEDTPYLVIKQVRIHLPPEFGANFPPLFVKARTVRSRENYSLHLTEQDSGMNGRPMAASFFSFGKIEWDAIQLIAWGDKQVDMLSANLDPSLAHLGLLSPEPARDDDDRLMAATDFGRKIGDLKYLIQIVENKLAERF
jgi:hypothetical protein